MRTRGLAITGKQINYAKHLVFAYKISIKLTEDSFSFSKVLDKVEAAIKANQVAKRNATIGKVIINDKHCLCYTANQINY